MSEDFGFDLSDLGLGIKYDSKILLTEVVFFLFFVVVFLRASVSSF